MLDCECGGEASFLNTWVLDAQQDPGELTSCLVMPASLSPSRPGAREQRPADLLETSVFRLVYDLGAVGAGA